VQLLVLFVTAVDILQDRHADAAVGAERQAEGGAGHDRGDVAARIGEQGRPLAG
jgi:hypothetical protein